MFALIHIIITGKRRRCSQENHGEGNSETTDISFVVEKFSENVSFY